LVINGVLVNFIEPVLVDEAVEVLLLVAVFVVVLDKRIDKDAPIVLLLVFVALIVTEKVGLDVGVLVLAGDLVVLEELVVVLDVVIEDVLVLVLRIVLVSFADFVKDGDADDVLERAGDNDKVGLEL
jgi:hypothetical protein